MSAEYGCEKLTLAVQRLACGTGDLRQRLENTWLANLDMLRVHRLPWDDLQERYEVLAGDLGPKGALATWPEDDLKRIAEEVFGLFLEVIRRRPLT